MKVQLFQLCYIDDIMDCYDVFDSIQIYDEMGLRDWLKTAIEEEIIRPEILEEHNLPKDINIGELELCDIMEIIQDDGFDIKQIEVNIE